MMNKRLVSEAVRNLKKVIYYLRDAVRGDYQIPWYEQDGVIMFHEGGFAGPC